MPVRQLFLDLVISHLDNSNELFYNILDTDIKQLQKVQNAAGKLVLRKGHYDSTIACVKDRHWQAVKLRDPTNCP